jgi:hypothetical protein
MNSCGLAERPAIGDTVVVFFETGEGVGIRVQVTVVKQIEDDQPSTFYTPHHCYKARVARQFRRLVGSKWIIVHAESDR